MAEVSRRTAALPPQDVVVMPRKRRVGNQQSATVVAPYNHHSSTPGRSVFQKSDRDLDAVLPEGRPERHKTQRIQTGPAAPISYRRANTGAAGVHGDVERRAPSSSAPSTSTYRRAQTGAYGDSDRRNPTSSTSSYRFTAYDEAEPRTIGTRTSSTSSPDFTVGRSDVHFRVGRTSDNSMRGSRSSSLSSHDSRVSSFDSMSRHGDGRNRMSDFDSMNRNDSVRKRTSRNSVHHGAQGARAAVLTRFQRSQAVSRSLTNNPRFSALTAILTLYALFGDDFRLATTRKNADIFFNILTVFCVLVFIIEVVACSLGQKDYFLGFFFILDVVSTGTLAFDLTWIGNALFCRNMNTETALKTSRAGRVGARASRTMRIIRLMRMVKLYKTYRTATKTEQDGEDTAPGNEIEPMAFLRDTADEGAVDPTSSARKSTASTMSTASDSSGGQVPMNEMRVGRKLSDMTTRRVIVLVLVMLFLLPQFSPEQHGREDFNVSGKFAAEGFYSWLREWCSLDLPSTFIDGKPWCLRAFETAAQVLLTSRTQQRVSLENQLLAYILSHYSDPNFAWRLYWVGFSSRSLGSDDSALGYLGRLWQLNQAVFLGNQSLSSQEFSARLANSVGTNKVPIPGTVVTRLQEPWQERCNDLVGVNVENENSVDKSTATASACSVDDELRCSEVEYLTPDALTAQEADFISPVFVFDKRDFSVPEALLSIAQTFFICLVVGVGALSFTKDANELLLDPIERMMAKVAVIKENPLAAIRLGDMEYTNEEKELEKQRSKLARMSSFAKTIYQYKTRYLKPKEPMETVMLERTIVKLGRLLALGFGEAGAAIVAHGLAAGTSSLRESDPGQPVDIMVGFYRIRHFVDAIEVLEAKVTLFVNQVCEIVHGCIDDFYGAPIRNIGDAFLVIWRLSSIPTERHARLADMAVMSSIRIITEINKSRMLALWRYHPGLLQRHKNFHVQMGFGLHRGWAIEGTIGSECKIDASYLSPNVSVAPKLEASTEHFGVYIVVSEPLIKTCSREMFQCSRVIDHVTIRGFKHALRLYTLDLDYSKVEVQWTKPEKVVRNPFKVRQLREIKKKEKWADDHTIVSAFETDQDLKGMRSTYSPQFFKRFSMAYRNYEVGEWMAARDMFLTCHYVPRPTIGKIMVAGKEDWPEDGPTVALLSFMCQTHFVPPAGWPGHRELP